MKRLYAVLLALATVAAVALVLKPLMLLQPFEPQTADDVALAYALGQWGPSATLVLLAIGAVLLGLAWKESSWWLRVPMILAVLLLAGTTFASRVNFVEHMFRPLAEAEFVSVAETGHLGAKEMVMGVRIGGEAKAYPVGMVAYHHVVNDRLGGVPLAVTY